MVLWYDVFNWQISQSIENRGIIRLVMMAMITQLLSDMRVIARNVFFCYRFATRREEIRQERRFRRCVFEEDVLSLKINEGRLSTYSWFGKYSALLKLSSDKDANSAVVNSYCQNQNSPYELALALQWISTLTHRLRSDIIHPQCYKSLLSKVPISLSKYYSQFDSPQKSQNLVLNPKLSLESLLVKSFIYQHHEDIAKLVKQNQLFILEKMVKMRELQIREFCMLISHNVFNVTDLSMLKTHFFNVFFHKTSDISHLLQIERMMAYLTNFGVLPICFPSYFLQFLQKFLKDNEKLAVSDLLSVSNILFQMVFHFHSTFQQSKQASNYAVLLEQLLKKIVVWQNRSEELGVLIKNNIALNGMIDSIVGIEISKMEKTISEERVQMDQLSFGTSTCLNTVLSKRLDLFKGQKLHQLLKRKSEVETRVKVTRFMLAVSYINPSLLDTTYRYLEFPKTFEFYMENPYIPNLLKYTKIALQLARNHQIHQNTKEIASYFSEELNKKCSSITKYLKNIEKDSLELLNNAENKQFMTDIVLQQKFESSIVKQDSDSLELQKIMKNTYSYEESVINLLKMLKNDEIFLSSLIKWNTDRFLSDSHIKDMNFTNREAPCWQYPFHFSQKVTNSQQQILKIHLKTAYNSNAILPNKKEGTQQSIFQGDLDKLSGVKIRLTQHSSKI